MGSREHQPGQHQGSNRLCMSARGPALSTPFALATESSAEAPPVCAQERLVRAWMPSAAARGAHRLPHASLTSAHEAARGRGRSRMPSSGQALASGQGFHSGQGFVSEFGAFHREYQFSRGSQQAPFRSSDDGERPDTPASALLTVGENCPKVCLPALKTACAEASPG